jgi:D-arginine dehydrogenase
VIAGLAGYGLLSPDVRSDFLIIGGGIAGASAGYFLAASGRVTLLERETVPGYHSTSRSAALFSEYYGNSCVRALTAASRGFYTSPPPGFTLPLLTPRGVLALCPRGAEERFEEVLAAGLTAPVPVRELRPGEAQRYCPVVRPGWHSRAMLKPAAMDIDVDALHQGFLRGIRARGGRVLHPVRLLSLRRGSGGWQAVTDAGEFCAGAVVNASGAWADEVAARAGVRPAGLTPLRRTAFVVAPPPGTEVAAWPMVADVTETFYFKPESGRLLVSPDDATPVAACDIRPADIDVATAIDRVRAATTLEIRHVQRAWAGLRTAAADDTPVIGEAPDAAGFFWLAGLSGYGIQTAPATGELTAALVTGRQSGITGQQAGFDPAAVAPGRLHSPISDRRFINSA